jgi:hypothetical protein
MRGVDHLAGRVSLIRSPWQLEALYRTPAIPGYGNSTIHARDFATALRGRLLQQVRRMSSYAEFEGVRGYKLSGLRPQQQFPQWSQKSVW